MTCDVAIIGAGAAGIAAARVLLARGFSVQMLEAGPRPGGRAFTESASLGAAFDHGASWLHDAEANPLTPLAEQLGFTFHRQPSRTKEGLMLGGRRASAAERADYLHAIQAAEAAFGAATGGADRDCAGLLPPGPWRATVAHWLGNIINGAPLHEISVQDYVAIDLHGENWQLAEGLGALVVRLAQGLPLRLNTPASRVDWSGALPEVTTPAGTLRARAVLVTVSTAVLAAGGLRFSPALPVAVQQAIQGLPLGLLSKVALRLAPGALAGLPAFSRFERPAADGTDAPMTFLLRPFGHDHLVGFIGGARAWALAREGPAASEAFCRAELACHLGAAEVARAVLPGGTATAWAQNPCFLGAYSHAVPGAAGARGVLREAALAGGRLRFAGEACHPSHAATLGGAWASGVAAAESLALTLAPAGR